MATAADIQRAFNNALGRDPSPTELAAFVAASSTQTDAQLYTAIATGPEAQQFAAPVIRFYQAAFGRVPDQVGLRNAETVLRANGFSAASLQQLASSFTTSTEFTNRYGTGSAIDAAFVAALYQNVLGRNGSPAEITAYTSGANGFTTRAQVLYAFAQSNEAQARFAGAVNAFNLAAAGGTATYSGPLTAQGGTQQGLTLTTSPDTIPSGTLTVTGDDTLAGFQSVSQLTGIGVNTLNDSDSIDLGAGNDTANIDLGNPNTVFAAFTVTPAAFKGIETLNLRQGTGGGGGGPITLNLINGDGNLGTLAVSNASVVTTVSNIASALGTVNLTNNSAAVVLTSNGGTALGGANDVLNLNVNTVTAGVTILGGYETVNLSSAGAGTNAFTLTGGTGLLNISGGTNLSVLNGTGGSNKIVNGSTATGNIIYNAGAPPVGTVNNTISTGTGNDFVAARNGADIVNLGTGIDALVQNTGDSATDTSDNTQQTVTGAFDLVTGLVATESLILNTGGAFAAYTINAYDNGAGATKLNIPGNNSIQAVRGNAVLAADGTVQSFTRSATGTDTLVQYDADNGAGTAYEAVVLRNSLVNIGTDTQIATTNTAATSGTGHVFSLIAAP